MRLFPSLLATSLLLSLGCSDGQIGGEALQAVEESDPPPDGAGGAAPDPTGGTGGDGIDIGGPGSSTPPPACSSQSAEAELTVKPVDIIFLIDRSGSMTEELAGVENNLNQNFASVIAESGLDYRVIMITAFGQPSSYGLCIDPPLGGAPCDGALQPTLGERFFHYNYPVESNDSLCDVFELYRTPDGSYYGYTDPNYVPLAPNGWAEWLRPDAFKVFVEITDDSVLCTAPTTGQTFDDGYWNSQYGTGAGGASAAGAAQAFDTALLALDPQQFGDATARNYVFHSIVGVATNEISPTTAYGPADPLVTTSCPTAVNPGLGYQELSRLTGGLRHPVCETGSYDAVFQAIATEVVQGAKVACEFPVPEAPVGQELDLASVEIEYTPSTGGAAQVLTQVGEAAACAAGSFYVDGETVIRLCPASCTAIQADPAAKIDVRFDCLQEVN